MRFILVSLSFLTLVTEITVGCKRGQKKKTVYLAPFWDMRNKICDIVYEFGKCLYVFHTIGIEHLCVRMNLIWTASFFRSGSRNLCISHVLRWQNDAHYIYHLTNHIHACHFGTTSFIGHFIYCVCCSAVFLFVFYTRSEFGSCSFFFIHFLRNVVFGSFYFLWLSSINIIIVCWVECLVSANTAWLAAYADNAHGIATECTIFEWTDGCNFFSSLLPSVCMCGAHGSSILHLNKARSQPTHTLATRKTHNRQSTNR